jgi:hypothetical protein
MFEGFKHNWLEQADAGGAGSATTIDANASQNGAGSAEDKGGAKETKPLVYADWLKEQPDEVKSMLGTWEGGLKSALQSEREARGAAEKALRVEAGKAEKGSEAEKKLTELADQMQEADRRAEFYDDAHRAGVTNLKLAYLSAVADERFDKRGRVNFDEMKKDYPELFGSRKPPEGNAGAGTGSSPNGKPSMDDFIRHKATGG